MNELGQKIMLEKIVRTKEMKFHNKVISRKKLKKFGDCEGLPPGPDPSTTIPGDEVFLETTRISKSGPKKTEEDYITPNLLCRTCGAVGDHWTHRCPFKNAIVPKQSLKDASQGSEPGNKYVIPSLRSGGGTSTGGTTDTGRSGHRRGDENTLRVTNISEETTDGDLSELFRPFGPISRIFLARDRHSNLSKGFAFINFVHRDDAEKALAKLNGYGYHHLILHVEWAKPSQ